jgi:5'-3' exonuclease
MRLNDNCYYGKTILIDADSLCFTSITDDLETALSKLEWKLDRLKKIINWNGQKFIFFLTLGKSFRNILQHDYKENRVQLRSDNVKKLKEYIIKKYKGKKETDVIFEDGYEADDLICDMYRQDSDNYLLCSVDKDILYNNPGKHINMYDLGPRVNSIVEVTEDEAIDNFYLQVIKGDAIDNIPDLIKGIGPVKLNLIKELTNLSYEEISKYICYKKGIDFTTRYRMLYCGKSEGFLLDGSNIEYNEVIDAFLENGKYVIKKEKSKVTKYTPNSKAPGKHKDKTWLEVKELDITYIDWMINATSNKELKEMLIKLTK